MEENLKNSNNNNLLLNNDIYNYYRPNRSRSCCLECQLCFCEIYVGLFDFYTNLRVLCKCCFTFYCYLLYYIIKEGFYLIKFIFLFPYIIMLYNFYKYCTRDFFFIFILLLFIPYFICFSILSISLFSIICFPSIYITKYRKLIKAFYITYVNEIPFNLIEIDKENNDNENND